MKRLYSIIIALMAICSSAMGQTISVASIEAEADTQTELVVTLSGVAVETTALQFNLNLPDGITLDETAITKGTAASNHVLDIRPLANGERLFVFYNTDMALITDGELLHLPITTGSEAGTLTGNINIVRTATTDAVSHTATGGNFTVTIAAAEKMCATPVLTYQNGKVRCTCETEGVTYVYTITSTGSTGQSTDGLISLGTSFTISVKATREGYADSDVATTTVNLAEVGDVNGDGDVDIADVTELVNLILGK